MACDSNRRIFSVLAGLIRRSGACRWKCGCLPRTRRRSVHDSRNLSRAPAASLRDRLRRPLTEPVCRLVLQLSGSGEGPGPGQGAAGLPEDGGEDQGAPLSSAGSHVQHGSTATSPHSCQQWRPAAHSASGPRGGSRPRAPRVWLRSPRFFTPYRPTRTRQDLPCTSAGEPRTPWLACH